MAVQGQPKQKVSETPISSNKPGVVMHTCRPLHRSINREISVHARHQRFRSIILGIWKAEIRKTEVQSK
jgi:hypothetical protein